MASTSCRCQSLSTVAPLNQVRLSPLAYPQTQICILCVALGEEVRVQQNTQMKDAICVMVKLEPKYASLSLSLSPRPNFLPQPTVAASTDRQRAYHHEGELCCWVHEHLSTAIEHPQGQLGVPCAFYNGWPQDPLGGTPPHGGGRESGSVTFGGGWRHKMPCTRWPWTAPMRKQRKPQHQPRRGGWRHGMGLQLVLGGCSLPSLLEK